MQDIILSSLALIVLSPVMLATAIAIVINDPSAGPIFSQERIGRNGKPFKFYKFRSMCPNAEAKLEDLLDQNEMDGPVFKIKASVSEVAIDEATGLARFVITCEIINGDVLRLNRAGAQIIVGETTGLRVPIDAIHYLKEDGTESETQGENYIPGVYVKYGNLARFCKIDPVDNDHPLVTDGEYRIVMPSSSDKTKTVSEVRLYDEIIVSGQNLYDGKLL